jgi:hypothetical protein
MNPRSRWAAAGIVFVTVLVCFLGVRAELAQAHRAGMQRTPHGTAPAIANLACGTDPTGGC